MTDALLKLGVHIIEIINQFEVLSLLTPRLATEDRFHWLYVTMKNTKGLNGNNGTYLLNT